MLTGASTMGMVMGPGLGLVVVAEPALDEAEGLTC